MCLYLTANKDELILTTLKELKTDVQLLTQLVQTLVKNEAYELPEGVELPLKSMKEVDRIERILQDEQIMKQMVNFKFSDLIPNGFIS